MWSTTQVPHIARVLLSGLVGIPEAKLRVVAPDVGGGFGSKLNVYAEEALALAIARRLGRPVKWTETRSEGYLSTIHGRDVWQEIELAATAEGKITAVRVRLVAAMGAYLQLVTTGRPAARRVALRRLVRRQGLQLRVHGRLHAHDADRRVSRRRPPRGDVRDRAGRRRARAGAWARIRSELRRLNFIREFPATIAAGLTIDSGDYDALLDRALENAGYESLRAEQAERRASGDPKRLGIGFSTYVEMCGLAPSKILGAIRYGAGGWDAATIRCLPTGTVQVLIGTSPHGQGHETTMAQIVADRLGYEMDEIEVLHGDTAVVPLGMDTYGSRSLAVGGVALYFATERIAEKAKRIAAHQLGVDVSQVTRDRGTFTGGDGSVTLKEIALSAWTAHDLPDEVEPGLEASFVYDPPNFSWPARRARRGRRGRHGDRSRRAAALRRGRRRRQGDQPDDRRRTGARRARAGRVAGALRGGALRRRRQPADRRR